jgi:uncharacterized membrane protein
MFAFDPSASIPLYSCCCSLALDCIIAAHYFDFAAIAATLLPLIDIGLLSLLIAAIAATLCSPSARFDLTSLCLLPSRSRA